jgi:hypothetical protein
MAWSRQAAVIRVAAHLGRDFSGLSDSTRRQQKFSRENAFSAAVAKVPNRKVPKTFSSGFDLDGKNHQKLRELSNRQCL